MRFVCKLCILASATMWSTVPSGFAQSANSADKTFVKEAAEGSNAEIELGKMAQQKGSADDVRQFGQRMVTDHTQLNQQMQPVAQALGVTPPAGTSASDKAEAAKLKALSGDSFDKAYIQAMVKDHQKDLNKFQTEAKTASDPELRQAAAQGADVIRQHLEMAERLAKMHNIEVSSR